MASLSERVLQRVAKEFTSPEQLKEYLRLHPEANKAKHTVKKQETPSKAKPPPIPESVKKKKPDPPAGAKQESKPEGKKPKHDNHDDEPEGAKPGRMEAWRDRLKGLSESAMSFAKSAPKAVKSFLGDPEFRKNTINEARKHVTAKAAMDRVVKTVKEEVKEYKTAAKGVKKLMSGGKMNKHEKHAFRTVAMHLAIGATAAAFAATGPLAAAGLFAKGMARQIALKSVKRSFENLHLMDELGHVGHGVSHFLEHVASETEADPEQALADLVLACVAKELENLDDAALVEALNGLEVLPSEEEEPKIAAIRVAARFAYQQ